MSGTGTIAGILCGAEQTHVNSCNLTLKTTSYTNDVRNVTVSALSILRLRV